MPKRKLQKKKPTSGIKDKGGKKIDCPWGVNLFFQQKSNSWKITQFIHEHNHEINESSTKICEIELWKKGVFSYDTPNGLSNAVFFGVSTNFMLKVRDDLGRRISGMSELRLKPADIKKVLLTEQIDVTN